MVKSKFSYVLHQKATFTLQDFWNMSSVHNHVFKAIFIQLGNIISIKLIKQH